jgi:protoheme IX farnesyltransferase
LKGKETYTASVTAASPGKSKLADYAMLVKFRLSTVVVISSVLGYLIASSGVVQWAEITLLVSGGFLVTAAANALNQVLEKDFDILMSRTQNRPVAAGRMKASEAVMFSGISCFTGITLLAVFNPITALLGMLSLILYAFVYTPLKRYSTLAVAVGAIPGALPVLIGATAFENGITYFSLSLFVIQFLWQFPHFWSIGFLGYDDYLKAGYKLLPENENGIDRSVGLSSVFYALLILPVVFFMHMRLDASLSASLTVICLTLVYALLGYMFHRDFDRVASRKLMFFSFFYLPAVLISYWLM